MIILKIYIAFSYFFINFVKLKKMIQDSLKDYNNNNLIGLKPEAIKSDIMKFKDEVLIDLKEIKKKFEEKYVKLNSEIKDSVDLFNQKLLSLNSKLLELSSQIVADNFTKEKLSELIAFQYKAENIMTSNKNKIIMNNEIVESRINYIEKLLKNSVFFPGLIGTNCKYKNFQEFIDYVFKQIICLNESKEQSIRDFKIYKSKVDTFMNSTKFKLDNIRNELIIMTSDKTQKTEEKMFQEMHHRDEKLKDIRIENQEYLLNLNKSLKNFNEDVNSVKELKESLNSRISQMGTENDEKINRIKEKFNGIESQIAILDRNIKKSVFHLNKNGAKIEIINYKKDKNNSGDNTEDEDFEDDGETKRNKNDEKDPYENGKNKKFPKYIKTKESEITKYIKGEITAEEIGKNSSHHKRIFSSNKNFFEERVLEKSDYLKNLTNKTNEENKKADYLSNDKKKSNEILINDYFYKNPLKKEDNGNSLKMDKKMSKTLGLYENIIKNNLNDLDAKFHSDVLATNFAQKNKGDNNKNILLKINKENNKNNLNSFNYTKILDKKKNKDYKTKTLNILAPYQVFSLKNIDQNLSFLSSKNGESFNRSLSPHIKKISEVKLGIGSNKNVNILNNLPKSPKSKISQKIFNSDIDNNIKRHIKISFHRDISSERHENT